MGKKWFLVSLLGVLSLVLFMARIFPEGANFSPVLAICLLSGFLAQKRLGLLVLPVIALITSDVLLGFYPGMAFNYLAFGALLFGGSFLSLRLSGFMAGGFLGAVTFFMISNFGVWFNTQMYSPDFAGLVTCYQMAIPFFRATLLSTVFYSFVFYGFASFVSAKLMKEDLVRA